MKKHVFLLICFIAFGRLIKGQELNCQVDINYTQIQGTANKQIFDQLQKAIFEFMNNTQKWTNNIYTIQERIDCSIFIAINSQVATDEYSGTIQIQAERPVFNSSYKTKILNVEDENFQFQFQQFTQLDFNINKFDNNLTSVLAYYAYVIIATDADSFAPLGGADYWAKATTIVNNAQSASEPGWQSSQQGQRNRFWLTENTLQPRYKGIRDCLYAYCRNGLDIMWEKTDEGRANILKSLDLLVPVAKLNPASYPMQLFFNAHADELINIFKGAPPEEKTKVTETLSIVDPANTTKYLKIQG